jgi:hypothetical protein
LGVFIFIPAVDFKILSVTFASTIVLFLYLFLGTIMNMRKKIYLSSLLLFSCTQILLAMDNTNYAVVDQEIDGLNNRDLVRFYNQIIEEAPQAQIDEQFMDIINNLLQDSALSVNSRVGLMNSRTDFMRDTVRAEVHRRVAEQTNSNNNNNNNNLRANDLDNQGDVEGVHDVSTVALNSGNNSASNTSNTNTHMQLPLPISTSQSLVQNVTVPAMGSVVELPSTVEIYPPARRTCMADLALQAPRPSLSYAKRHPYVLASAALMATGVLGYALKKPLLNLLDQAKIRAQHTYRNLMKSKAMRYVASRVFKPQEKQNNQDVDAGMACIDSRRKNFIETLLVQLMASMNDEQLKQPAVATVIDQAWQGDILALNNAQFKALLRQDQRELLAKASII